MTHYANHDELIHALERKICGFISLNHRFRTEGNQLCLIGEGIGTNQLRTIQIGIHRQLIRLKEIV